MNYYEKLDANQLHPILEGLCAELSEQKKQGLKLDMSRGKPNDDQLVFSRAMLDTINSKSGTKAENGVETLNYMCLDGIPEAKRLMAPLLQVADDEVFVGGNSSLNLMHDLMVFCWLFPLPGASLPWCRQDGVKFLCPVPGYDRHFAVTQHFGIEMIAVPMTKNGPDMDIVEDLVSQDDKIKGMWCVPKYSNPQGITYSDETVKRIAALKPAAADFRVFWDNAYSVHDFYENKKSELLPLLPELKKNGHENNAFIFTSTSKISFPGAGISAIGASKENLEYIKKHMSIQTIGYDKSNQLRHARFFKDYNGILEHMKLHAAAMRPKFETVLNILDEELGELGLAKWEKPLGGYFICLETLSGCAKRTAALCKECGLAMTPAGATHPYGIEDADRTIRIAPTYPGIEELAKAAKLLCLCVKIATLEKLTGKATIVSK